ncbi:MAG: thiamine pyrophosphate-binding protein [Candidatus Rokubacteria bacterium]|nr:thiamine pyrophosphate-binding protein [Candidatus Rokubacteria bacterium]
MNNAELIVRTLLAAGVTHGFGIPSGNVLPLLEAMRTGDLPFVLTAHEGSAAFAADVMGRLTDAPGLAIATLGPGATNLATGVGGAYLDRSPMLALTCNLPTAQLGRRIQMAIDHHALLRPITKATLALRRGRVASVLAEAIEIALSAPCGPVHLDLPEDVALAQAAEDVPAIPSGRRQAAAPEQAIERAGELLRRARRPVAVVGASAMRLRRPALVRDLVERHGLPFASTTMAKGLVDEHHPLALGCIERARRQVQREFLRGADLVVGVGYDVVEVEYEAWIGDTPLLAIDVEAVDADRTVDVVHEVIGDLDASLERLVRLEPAPHDWPPDAAREHATRFQRSLRPAASGPAAAPSGFSPHQAIDVVRAALPRQGVLAFDVGAHTHQIASQWTVHEPGTFLITNGWSSMGFGIPAAIAAKLARPDRAVVAVVGDGCFQMTCGEVAAARRLGLSLPIVVLDDGWLSLIRVKQHRRRFGVWGTEVGRGERREPPAHYFGVPVLGARTPDALAKALEHALHVDHPTVIEAAVDPASYLETVYD